MKATKQHAACWLQFVVAGFAFAANPLFTDKWTADPAPLVDGDTLYLFTSHDEAKDGELFHMDDWALFSTKDLKTWKSHPAPLAIKDLEWAKDPSAWAELFEVPVDYAPQGYGLAFLEISSKCQPVLKAGKRYVLEMRGAKGASTCYWRRSRDGDKRHAFALYGAGS